MITLRQAIDKTLQRISLAQGVDVQTYSEEQIRDIIVHKIHVIFDSAWWPQFYNPGETFTLDGTTGVVTADVTADHDLSRFMDIRYVWYGTERNPLPRAPIRMNPSLIKVRCVAPSDQAGKVFKILPVTTTGTVMVAFRARPTDPEEDNDLIDLDDDLIILGSAYDYLNSLGTNPDEEGKLLRMFDSRFKTLTDAIESGEVSLAAYDSTSVSADWQELP